MVLFVFAVALACGCAHRDRLADEALQESQVAPTVGFTHSPYRGKPAYLASSRPLQSVARPQPGADNPCAQRSRTCDDRLRALLAGVDGELLALSSPPQPKQLEALKLSMADLPSLLAPYSDVASESDELTASVGKLATATPVDQDAVRKRMQELLDLIRVQLAAAQ